MGFVPEGQIVIIVIYHILFLLDALMYFTPFIWKIAPSAYDVSD